MDASTRYRRIKSTARNAWPGIDAPCGHTTGQAKRRSVKTGSR